MKSWIKLGICNALLLSMFGCGGSGKSSSSTTYTIGGTVTGFTGSGLVLQDNGGDNLTLSAGASSFTFAKPIASGDVYSVTVMTQPAGENCSVTNGDGTATANVASVSVNCSSLFTIGGSISGLIGPGLVLTDNGGDNLTVAAGATSFTFATPLANGSAYNVAIAAQPDGETCTVTNGTGTASANVTGVGISCAQYDAVSGTVTGLKNAGLVLQDNGGDNLTVAAGAASFTFATPLVDGSAYNVTILTQPAGENCTVNGGSGTVVAGVVNASVVCVGEWAWTGGSSTIGLNSAQPGVYGTLGTAAAANIPGARTQSATWKDAHGNLWLFGGYGYDANGTPGQLNDLWKFDPTLGTNGEWTWIGGSSVAVPPISTTFPYGASGTYGTVGVAAPANVPGGREQSVTWVDAAGNLWLFGGIGIDSVGIYGYLNDLWEFNPTSGEWTWMGGSNTAPPNEFQPEGNPGVYGTEGQAAASNIPGARYGGYAWVDAAGNFWLFGGNGFDSVQTNGYLNDLWKYTPGANNTPGNWTWVSGNSAVPPSPAPWIQSAWPGVYGTEGAPAAANEPGGRSSGVTWVDASGNLWLFGGLGDDSLGNTGYLNDLWEYSTSSNQWTWQGGGDTVGTYGGQPGVYGIEGLSDPANTPGARYSPSTWTDATGNLWLFGGQGYDWTGSAAGLLNDLWMYTPGTGGSLGQWTWEGGSNIIPPSPGLYTMGGQPGVYGTLGTPAATNTPGARVGAMSWFDSNGNLWLIGGQGYDGAGNQGYLNDVWKFQQ